MRLFCAFEVVSEWRLYAGLSIHLGERLGLGAKGGAGTGVLGRRRPSRLAAGLPRVRISPLDYGRVSMLVKKCLQAVVIPVKMDADADGKVIGREATALD